MANFTYDQFLSAAQASGLSGSFSAADLALAQRNPDAGMSLLSFKKDYRNATTDEQRALANTGANEIRTQYGGYTGGEDGSGYYLASPTPSSFSPSTPAPAWNDTTAARRNAKLDEIQNYGAFSYDAASDPLYAQYKKQYAREGQRAAENTLASISAQSGGLASSAAATAAAQAGNYYAAQAADKVPELEQLAYDKYLNDFSLKQSQLAALNTERQALYDEYLNDLSQWNTENNFKYGQHSDQISYDTNRRAEQRELADLVYNRTGDASGYQTVGLTPEQTANMKNAWDTDKAWENAERRYAVGDLGGYEGLADTGYASALQQQELQKIAQENADWNAGYYDYSGLKANGVDTSNLEQLLQLEIAQQQAALNGSSGGYYSGSSGVGAGAGSANTGDASGYVSNRTSEDGDFIYVDGAGWVSWSDIEKGLARGLYAESRAANGKITIVAPQAVTNRLTGQTDTLN